jgi:hypothetical protein
VAAPEDIRATVLAELADGTEVTLGRLGAARPDLGVVDGLARLQLALRRRGARLRLRGAPPELAGLLRLCGLDAAVGAQPPGQAELGEEPGEEEVVQPGDPPL